MPRERDWRDPATLLDIAGAARDAIEFARGIDEAAFRKDDKLQSAVIWKVLLIGEATKRLSPEFTAAHPEIQWSDIAGMRDRLIYGYEMIRLEEVWNVVVNDLPRLLGVIEPHLPRRSGGP